MSYLTLLNVINCPYLTLLVFHIIQYQIHILL
jgi:hypothetical protein